MGWWFHRARYRLGRSQHLAHRVASPPRSAGPDPDLRHPVHHAEAQATPDLKPFGQLTRWAEALTIDHNRSGRACVGRTSTLPPASLTSATHVAPSDAPREPSPRGAVPPLPIDRRVYRSAKGTIPRSRHGTGPCLGLVTVGVSTAAAHAPRSKTTPADPPSTATILARVRNVLNELKTIVR